MPLAVLNSPELPVDSSAFINTTNGGYFRIEVADKDCELLRTYIANDTCELNTIRALAYRYMVNHDGGYYDISYAIAGTDYEEPQLVFIERVANDMIS